MCGIYDFAKNRYKNVAGNIIIVYASIVGNSLGTRKVESATRFCMGFYYTLVKMRVNSFI
jgi:hypothetical protein